MLADDLGDPRKRKITLGVLPTKPAGRSCRRQCAQLCLQTRYVEISTDGGNLADVVRESVARQQRPLATGAKLDMQIATHLPDVQFDHDGRANSQNLLDNAEKHRVPDSTGFFGRERRGHSYRSGSRPGSPMTYAGMLSIRAWP
jgi:hypothetical protein